jgi:hypothetical protein
MMIHSATMIIYDDDDDDDVIEKKFDGCKNVMNSCLLKILQLKQSDE